jgi:hypothetical protein
VRSRFFYGWVVAAGWIAIVAGSAALMIRKREPAPAALQAA